MAQKNVRRLNIHWSPEWDDRIVMRAKQLAIGKAISFSAFVAEALKHEVDREASIQEKGPRK